MKPSSLASIFVFGCAVCRNVDCVSTPYNDGAVGDPRDRLLAESIELEAATCDIARMNDISVSTFSSSYKGKHPVIFRRRRSGVSSMAATLGRASLLDEYGRLEVVLASSNSFSYAKRRATLSDYLTNYMSPQEIGRPANSTWYLFGDTTVTDEWKPLVDAYALPLDAAADEGIVAWGVSGRWHGVQFHTHGAAFAEAVHGRKRWYLTAPSLRPEFDPDEGMLTWTLRHIERKRARRRAAGLDTAALSPLGALLANASSGGSRGAASSSGSGRFWECTAHEGDILYIPPQWWHATLNLDGYNAFVSVFTLEKFSLAPLSVDPGSPEPQPELGGGDPGSDGEYAARPSQAKRPGAS